MEKGQPDITTVEATFPRKYGSRLDVWYGIAEVTRGGSLRKDDLFQEDGKIKSRKASERGRVRFQTDATFREAVVSALSKRWKGPDVEPAVTAAS